MLQNEEIVLRPISLKDTDFILELRNDLDTAANFFSDLPLYDFKHLQWLKGKENDEIDLIIEVAGEKAGRIRAHNMDYKHQKCEYEIVLHKNYRRKNVAKRASILLINYIFTNLPIRKIYLHVFEDNRAAVELYKKLHFEVEGTFKEEFFKNGKWKNVLRMALFKDSWLKLSKDSYLADK